MISRVPLLLQLKFIIIARQHCFWSSWSNRVIIAVMTALIIIVYDDCNDDDYDSDDDV